ncbi:hypothetical protein A1F94_003795 [Pyrenophora tritici-repentis]|uniref:Uncharacterized protein n=2 Tax=Pyrenophora tritici-repentis TaxID=45151 RepID=A0A317ASR6_9PLEO|nr:hypothetical protein PtrV1_05017 [Pyrenophora tritici-repentis]KAF7452690.1 hypothetical protein A1F99_044680 [Pyrenophora tritici-repentis]KAG9387045.1 hypothetical protein A1F94_003795 [Pyrenophora tritici-repentis]KAI1508931.1 hypothetical protein Ptr86124_012230 [Pyrenophora tritici-repentis]KAI1685813.1 hypothetical protein KJE20_03778 [Pyrenophora tritici-repentis]
MATHITSLTFNSESLCGYTSDGEFSGCPQDVFDLVANSNWKKTLEDISPQLVNLREITILSPDSLSGDKWDHDGYEMNGRARMSDVWTVAVSQVLLGLSPKLDDIASLRIATSLQRANNFWPMFLPVSKARSIFDNKSGYKSLTALHVGIELGRACQVSGNTIAAGCNRISTLRCLSLHVVIDMDSSDNNSAYYMAEVASSDHVKFCDCVLSGLQALRLQYLSLNGFKTTSTLPKLLSSSASLRHLEIMEQGVGDKVQWGITLAEMRRLCYLQCLTLDRIHSTILGFGDYTKKWEVVFGDQYVHQYHWNSERNTDDCVGGIKRLQSLRDFQDDCTCCPEATQLV